MTTTDTRPDIPLGYTHNSNGKVLTYRNNSGYWCERTYDDNGKVRTYKSNSGIDCTVLAYASSYTLLYETRTHKYRAGCRVFTRAEALAHWGTPRDDNAGRAAIFVAAINNHKE